MNGEPVRKNKGNEHKGLEEWEKRGCERRRWERDGGGEENVCNKARLQTRLYSLFTCWGRREVSCVFRARDLCSAAPTDQKWFTARRIHVYVLHNGAFARCSPAQSYLIKWDAHSASANLSRFCSFSDFYSPLRLTTRLAEEEEKEGKKKTIQVQWKHFISLLSSA